jgi:predicted XRE-type DNA-binding protein
VLQKAYYFCLFSISFSIRAWCCLVHVALGGIFYEVAVYNNIFFISPQTMSKRKLGISYSSLRRQVRTQVDADLRLIGNLHNEVSSDESSENADAAYPMMHVDSRSKPVDVHVECDQAIENASTSQYNFSEIDDFDDCHWANSSTDSESDTSEEEMHNTSDVVSHINEWANKYMLPHVAVTELMHILKPHLSELPYDSRTLLHTPRSCNVKKLICGGEYCHLGLAKGLQELIMSAVTSPTPRNRCLER